MWEQILNQEDSVKSGNCYMLQNAKLEAIAEGVADRTIDTHCISLPSFWRWRQHSGMQKKGE